jgi:subtilisin family serine protease
VGDGSYDANANEIDDFVWNHRDLVVCFAAGNAGKDSSGTGRVAPGSVGAPSTAKNCITVGASENNRPDFPALPAMLPVQFLTYGAGWPSDFPTGPISDDRVADNIEGMAGFSGRGPTTDHRIKPDVVAPGTAILSALSRAVATPAGWGPSKDNLYFFEGGTSMATPLAAGCAALVREFLIKHPTTPVKIPSAALVKALLINGAKPIAGQYTPSEAGDIPSINQGFGRIDLQATVGPFGAGTTVSFHDEKTELDTNQEERTPVKVPAGARQLKVTLVWTDPAGETLQNDLDLIVQAQGGQERHGNVPDSSNDFDRSNNVEQVLWNNPPAGDAVIIVKAFRVTRLPQSYALVVRIS